MSKRLADLGEQLRQARKETRGVEIEADEAQNEVPEKVQDKPPQKTRQQSERVRHTVYLPPDISRLVRLEKAETGDEISEIVTKACEQYFKSK